MAKFSQICALFTLFILFHCYSFTESQNEPVATSTPWPYTPTTMPNAPTTNPPSSEMQTSTAGIFQEETTSSVSTSTDRGTTDCDVPLTIGNYCMGFLSLEGDDEVLSYFNTTTSVDDILHMIIDVDAVRALSSECEPGVWCLEDSFHEKIYHGMSGFYSSPICNQALWDCLESMAEIREDCYDTGNLYALLEVLTLLCDMNALKNLQQECYTRTVEILNLLYSDETRGAFIDFNGPLCAEYTQKIVKSFLCTADACGFNQTVFLRQFDALEDIALNSEMVREECHLDNVCPGNTTLAPRVDYNSMNFTAGNGTGLSPDQIIQEELQEEDELDKLFDELEKELEEEKEQDEKKGKEGTAKISEPGTFNDATTVGEGDENGEINEDTLGVSTFSMGGDTTILFGTITLSVLALIGLMVILFLGLRHYKRTRRAAYKKGYSQLSEEESRMLTYE